MLGLMARSDCTAPSVWAWLPSVWAWLAIVGCVGGCHVELFDPFTAGDAAGDVADEEVGDGVEGADEAGEGGGEAAEDGPNGDDTPLFDVIDEQAELSSCEFAASLPSHLGCEFFGLDLDQAGLADYDAYGFVVINPQSRAVSVTLERFVDHGWLVSESATIEPEQAHVFLPSDFHKLTTGLFDSAVLRIRSEHPVIAIQASPAEYNLGEPGYSASASLLQPTSSWADQTRVAGWRTVEGVAEYAFLGIVTLEDFTPINVDPTFLVAPGPDDPPDTWTDPIEVSVSGGQLLRLSAEPDPLVGIAGTRIWSGQEHRSAVFAAHSCAAIPSYEGSCGHMQEQLGNGLLGLHFVVPRLLARVDVQGDDVPELIHERTMIQIVADEPDTLVTVLHGQDEVVESFVLDPDEPRAFFEHERELAVVSDKPVAIAAYMTDAEYTELGSASMVQLAPVEQWTTSHWVWVPQGFSTHLVVLGSQPSGIEITPLAHVPLAIAPDQIPNPIPPPLPTVPSWPIEQTSVEAEGVGAHEVTRWAVGPGIYRIDSASPTSVVVVGARVMDGFAYLGGWGPSLVDIGPPT
jgi:hypothetical protein